MPHKRAKQSAREELRRQRGIDLAPGKDSLNSEVIHKSASRVLNAVKIREEWKSKRQRLGAASGEREKKRRKVVSDEDGTSLGGIHQKIQPGEPIQHFNRRVEDGMRPIIRSAIQASKATVRQNFKAEMKARQRAKALKQDSFEMAALASPSNADEGKSKPKDSASKATVASAKEFAKASTSIPRRLNDVVQAPPSLTTLRLSARKLQQGIGASSRDDVLSMAQRSLMEKEREKAIRRYRQLKATKRKLHAVKGADEGIVSDVEDVVAS